MNAVANRNRTLGELMTELRARTGFISQGSASKNNDALVKSFLQEAHDFVYMQLEPPSQRRKTALQLQAGSFLYDWNDDERDEPIEPDRVLSMWLRVTDTQRTQLRQGITELQRADEGRRDEPQRYDNLDGQIELWPVPDQAYQLTIEYTADCGRFDRTSDRSSVNDRLVFLYALATAKAHYRQPDAQASAAAFEAMLRTEKGKSKGQKRYFAKGFEPGDQDPSEQVQQVVGQAPSAVGVYTSQAGG